MSVHEPDGMAESIDELLRLGMMLAARMAEQRVRAREQQLRDAEAESVQAAAATREQFARQRASAVAALEGVHSDAWWIHADAGDIRQAWLTAREWAGEEPRASRAVWQIADQLKDRYGLDVHTIDPAAFGQQPELRAQTGISDRQLVHIDQLLQECSEQLYGDRDSVPPDRQPQIDQRLAEVEDLRGELAARRSGPPPSVEAPTASERDRGGREQRDAQRTIATIGADLPLIGGYDTPERRQRLAERLTAVGVDATTVAAIASADVAQAHPAGDAPQATSSPSASPNRTRSRGPSQARQARRRP